MVPFYDSLHFGSWQPLLVQPWLLLGAATVIEFTWGEPPSALHPVVWMGKLCSACVSVAPRRGRLLPFLFGLAVAVVLPVGFAGVSAWVLSSLSAHPGLRFLVAAWLLSTTFSVRALGRAAREVSAALRSPGGMDCARQRLRALCSRDPQRLDAPLLAAAAIESVAENSSDSFVAPLFYFALLGVPGAVLYRTVNTLDAMIGYRGKYEFLGKAAARTDDLLNWIPARLTALLLLVSGKITGHPFGRGLRITLRDHKKTESPNAGWPMAAMAGLLGIQLEKLDHYALGDATIPVSADHIEDSWKVARTCFFCALVLIASWNLAWKPGGVLA